MRYTLYLSLIMCLPLAAQRPVQRFDNGHPLANGYITDVLESQEGFLYVASQAGLRRFDGEETISLGPAYGNLGGSPHTLFETRDGDLWVGHHRGLTRFSAREERFYNYGSPDYDAQKSSARTTLFRLAGNDEGTTLWGLSDQGIVAFDVENQSWHTGTALRRRQDSLRTGHCTDIVRTSDGNFLLACERGIFRLEEKTEQLSVAYPDSLNQLGAFRLLPAPAGVVLVGGREIVYRLQPTSGGQLSFAGQLDLAGNDKADRSLCMDLLETAPGEYYVATNRGLHTFHWHPRQPFDSSILITSLHHDADDEASLSSEQINALAPASGNLLLIGTRKGISRLPVGASPFSTFHRKPGRVELCNNNVKGMAVDPAHELLILGTTTGLSLYHYPSGKWWCYGPGDLPGLRSPYLINVDPGPRPHTFWLLYRKGGADLLDLTDPTHPTVSPGIHPADATDVTHAYEVAYQADGTCYIATGRGIYRYNPLSGQGTWLQNDPADSTSLPDNYCYAVYVDHNDRVWVGTRTAGLCRLYEGEAGPVFERWRKEEDNPASLSGNLVLNIFEDRNQHLWISTAGGISLWESEGKFRNFGEDDGLPHPLSYGIFEDGTGQLWTVQGGQITRIGLDPEGNFLVGAGFRQRDGMADDFCTQYGWEKLPDGRVVISHPGGLSLFHPDSLNKDNYLPPVLLTEIQLFNRPVAIAGSLADTIGGQIVLPTAPQRLRSLHLPPGQNFLSLSFAAPEFRPYRKARYGWRMPGIQDEWADTDGRNYLSFPKLPPGDYLLQLRSGGQHGQWSDQVRSLAISLAAPWYQRWWAITGFVVLAATGIFWLARLSERQRLRVEAARAQEREEFRRRSARDFHDEAGNHLSRVGLLSSLAEMKLAEGDAAARTQVQGMLQEISANTQVLREGMRDFIWALDPDNDNAGELALRLKRFGQDLFAHHPAELRIGPFAEGLHKISLRAGERRHLMLLAKEAMHNSLKHAPEATVLELQIYQLRNQLCVGWSDNGPGFSESESTEGMGMKNMRTRAEKMGASFSIESTNGCTIRIGLPLS